MSFKEQIIFKDKYLSIFLYSEMKAIVFIILQIFFRNTQSSENWGISGSDIQQI